MDLDFSQILEREKKWTQELCRLTGINFPGNGIIESALQKPESAWGGLIEHDRFMPEDLGMPELFNGLYVFNSEHSGELKLCHTLKEEWWRTDSDAEHLPTVAGIIRQDLRLIMTPTDFLGRPFNLDMDEHVEWAKEQGGDNIDSVEETLFLVLRKALELNCAPWAYGWARSRNSGGSSGSLEVGWDAEGGLRVNCGRRGGQDSGDGALVRKFLALVA